MSANEEQVGGSHYKAPVQHWDMVVMHDLNYFEGQITKYVMRARKKNGKQDLEKAKHFLEKYLEVWDLVVPPEPVLEADARMMPPPSSVALELHSDAEWQCEGFYGDMTQLYRHRKSRALYRAASLQDASGCHSEAFNWAGAGASSSYINQG